MCVGVCVLTGQGLTQHKGVTLQVTTVVLVSDCPLWLQTPAGGP